MPDVLDELDYNLDSLVGPPPDNKKLNVETTGLLPRLPDGNNSGRSKFSWSNGGSPEKEPPVDKPETDDFMNEVDELLLEQDLLSPTAAIATSKTLAKSKGNKENQGNNAPKRAEKSPERG